MRVRLLVRRGRTVPPLRGLPRHDRHPQCWRCASWNERGRSSDERGTQGDLGVALEQARTAPWRPARSAGRRPRPVRQRGPAGQRDLDDALANDQCHHGRSLDLVRRATGLADHVRELPAVAGRPISFGEVRGRAGPTASFTSLGQIHIRYSGRCRSSPRDHAACACACQPRWRPGYCGADYLPVEPTVLVEVEDDPLVAWGIFRHDPACFGFERAINDRPGAGPWTSPGPLSEARVRGAERRGEPNYANPE